MALVTFTSDFGTNDYYVAAIKGALFTHCEELVPIVDVTHHIKPFDVKQAAYIVRNSYKYFPSGSIHLVHLNGQSNNNRLLVSKIDGHYFIVFDNGLLSLAFEKIPQETYEVNEELIAGSNHLMDAAIGKVVNFLRKDYQPSDFAHLTTNVVQYRLLQPLTGAGRVQGSVVYIDGFGNAITNITPQMLAQHIGDKKFTIYVGVGQVKQISTNYYDSEEGELLALYSISGFLELAINKGRADKLLALRVGTPVQVIAD